VGKWQKMAMHKIRTKADLKAGVTALTRGCRRMAQIYALAGEPPLRRRPTGFKGLSRIIVSQQLSVASAGAIWRRFEARVQPFTATSLLAVSDGDLARAGLSVAKIATLRGLAAAVEDRSLDLEALAEAPEEVINAKLTALKGVGAWTADIYILFCLARADAWSPGDLALQHAVRDAFNLEARPSPQRMIEIAECWRPWRSVAARMLWSYYALRRKTSAAPA
jgi:DNA-3-methyladenine glycosylase II